MDIKSIIDALTEEFSKKKTINLKQVTTFLVAKFPTVANTNRIVSTYSPRKTDSRNLVPRTEQEKKLGVTIRTGKDSSISDAQR